MNKLKSVFFFFMRITGRGSMTTANISWGLSVLKLWYCGRMIKARAEVSNAQYYIPRTYFSFLIWLWRLSHGRSGLGSTWTGPLACKGRQNYNFRKYLNYMHNTDQKNKAFLHWQRQVYKKKKDSWKTLFVHRGDVQYLCPEENWFFLKLYFCQCIIYSWGTLGGNLLMVSIMRENNYNSQNLFPSTWLLYLRNLEPFNQNYVYYT